MRCKSPRSLALVLLLAALIAAAPPTTALTEDQIIDQVMTFRSIEGADDLLEELRELAAAFAADPEDYGGFGVNLTSVLTHPLHFRGTTVSTMSMCLPLLEGDANDASTPRGRLAQRLRKHVTDFLLNRSYWEWEHATRTGAPYLSSPNPEVTFSWDHRRRGGPWWEKMHGLWAYAHYSGDWQIVRDNWAFIRGAYDAGYRTPDDFQRSCIGASISQRRNTMRYRIAMNDLANGLIGYVRMAERMKDASAAQARAEARAALAQVAARVDVPWDRCPAIENWTDNLTAVRGEWTPGHNLTPELGRWINDRARDAALRRLDEAAGAGPLRGHWWCGFLNNYSKGSREWMAEDLWGLPALSHQLFLGRAWMLQESAADLRQVKPWHVVMGRVPQHHDMLYIRSLYALISRHADVQWAPASQ